MKLNKETKILIIGLGVIGGSYAKKLTDEGYRVKAITINEADLAYAIENRMIEGGSTTVDPELVGEAELVIFALYPTIFIEWIKENQHLFTPGTLITDVSGVKTAVVDPIQAILRPDVEFISAHPMAGREASGVMYADPKVFIGANYIVTPTEKNSREAIETCKELGRILGFSRTSELTAEVHDEMIAFLSQLTHVIAVTLMTSNDQEGLEKYTGDSFRDLTRIARINDAMWSELFLTNKDALLGEMDAFMAEFMEFRRMLSEGDREGMRAKMRESTARRALFDKPKA